MKPFYVHINKGPGKLPNHYPRGATIYVAQDKEDERMCVVGIAYCSPKDQFCKNTGRLIARNTILHVINKRSLKKIVDQVYEKVHGDDPWTSEYDYLYKYML